MTEFGLPRHPHRKGSSPDFKIRNMSGFGWPSQGPRDLWSKIKLPALHRRHFGELPAALGQEALSRSSLVPAPSHASKIIQSWTRRKIPSYISKEVWPARSPDLTPLVFSIRSILETKARSSPHPTV